MRCDAGMHADCNVDSTKRDCTAETDNHCFCLKIYRTPRIEPPWRVRQSIVNFIDMMMRVRSTVHTVGCRRTAINRFKIINKIGASRASIATDILFVRKRLCSVTANTSNIFFS